MLLSLSRNRGVDICRYDARIHPEPQFRCPATIRESDNLARRIVVSRWTGYSAGPQEHRAEILDEYHTIAISMASAKLRFSVSDRIVFEGNLDAGTVQLSSPGQQLCIRTSGAYDWLHIHVGSNLLRSCQAMLRRRPRGCPPFMKQDLLFRDHVIHDLVNGLVNIREPHTPVSALCGESIILAVIARILDRRAQSHVLEVAPRATALIAWRLKRVKDFVAEHLADCITLAELSRAAGLTRMHFAAQFRAATGMRPHDYVLQQRIARAKELLLHTDMKLVEIALAVGFQTQAHFTTVFGRMALATPRQWRCRETTVQQPRYHPVVGRSGVRHVHSGQGRP
jgi:AraC family transcriptional regulator